MQEKMLPSSEPANRKGWGLALNIQPQVCHSRMAALNENLLPFLTQYVLCSMMGNSPHTYVMAYGLKLQTLPLISKIIFSLPIAYKELLHVIRYVLDVKNIGLKIQFTINSNKPWEIICFSDSDYAGDPMSMQNISGLILYVFGVPVSWQSKS